MSDEAAFLDFVRRLLAIRRTQPVLRRRTFLSGRRAGATDVLWLRPDGAERTDADWADPAQAVLAMLLNGDSILEPDLRGQPIVGDSVLAIFNGADREIEFTLPAKAGGSAWARLLDTADPEGQRVVAPFDNKVLAVARSVSIWRTGRG